MKVRNYIFAVFLPFLISGCSQGIKQSSNSSEIGANAQNRSVANWDRVKDDQEDEKLPLRRLESVTWDSVKHELKWEISTGKKKGDGYRPRSSDRYEINMDKATMTFNGASRRFSQDEALKVRTLMDFVSKYAVESTVWWEQGEGEPIDGKETPGKPDRQKPDTEPRDGGKSKAVGIVAMQIVAE